MLLEEWDNEDGTTKEKEALEESNLEGTREEGDTGVSLHALSGKTCPSTFKIKGYVGKRVISILIDSGNTNSFIDEFLVNGIKVLTVPTTVTTVTVANGEKMRRV